MNKEIVVNKHLTFKTMDKKEVEISFKIELAKYNGVKLRDYDTLEIVENPIGLSIIGEHNDRIGQCQESIAEELDNLNPRDKALVDKLLDVWYEYDNNLWLDLTKRQNKVLTKLYLEKDDVSIRELKDYLKENNLLEDKGYVYEYNSNKLCNKIPEEVINFIKNL